MENAKELKIPDSAKLHPNDIILSFLDADNVCEELQEVILKLSELACFDENRDAIVMVAKVIAHFRKCTKGRSIDAILKTIGEANDVEFKYGLPF